MAKKRYRVVGESVVAGHEPGEEFSFDFDGYNLEALLEGGHIVALDAEKKPDKSKEE